MPLIRLALFIIFAALALPVTAQDYFHIQVFDTAYTAYNSATISSTGSIYATGYRQSEVIIKGILRLDLRITKYSRTGEVIWNKEYFDADTSLKGASITELPNNTFLITGLAENHGVTISTFILNIDSLGNQISAQQLQFSKHTLPINVTSCPDGGTLIMTNTHSHWNGEYSWGIQLNKFNSRNELEWQKEIDKFSYDFNILFKDSNFYFITSNEKEEKLWIVKCNNRGERLKSVTVPCNKYTPVASCSYGEGFIFAFSDLDENGLYYIKLIAVDDELNQLWTRKIFNAGNAIVHGILFRSDSIEMTGEADVFGSKDPFYARFTPATNQITAKRVGNEEDQVSYHHHEYAGVNFGKDHFVMGGVSRSDPKDLMKATLIYCGYNYSSECTRSIKLWQEEDQAVLSTEDIQINSFLSPAENFDVESKFSSLEIKHECFSVPDPELDPSSNFYAIEVLPNPFEHFLRFKFLYQSFPSDLQIDLIDATGRLIQVYYPNEGEIYEINTAGLAAGLRV